MEAVSPKETLFKGYTDMIKELSTDAADVDY